MQSQHQRLGSPTRRPQPPQQPQIQIQKFPPPSNRDSTSPPPPTPSTAPPGSIPMNTHSNSSMNNTNNVVKPAKLSRRSSNSNSLMSVLKPTPIPNNNDSCNCSSNCACKSNNTGSIYGALQDDQLPFLGTPNTMSIPHVRVDYNLSWHDKLHYYFPCYSWIPNYTFESMIHDLMAGLSLASYQIPLSMSFASAVAHVPPICGLLGLSIAPIIYALLGSVPQLIIGPEAAVSMIVGQAIEKTIKHNQDMNLDPIDILVVLTSTSGAILLGFGLARFGYIDNVLCGSLLRGFITAIGISMILNSIISVLGLDSVLNHLPISDTNHYHTIYEKMKFLMRYWRSYHSNTAIVGFTSFLVLLVFRTIKKKLVKHRYKKFSFVPEILIVVVITTFLSYNFKFHKKLGIDIIGNISAKGFKFRIPFDSTTKEFKDKNFYSDLFTVSLMVAILGFFESSTASKSLSSNLEMPISSNRELVALGSVGIIISCFGSLPSFGGYGRSKLNAMNGARTPMAGAFMGITTLLVTLYMLSYLHHLPICVLNSIIAIIGLSLISETPADLKFHIRTKGYNELITFLVTLLASCLYSIEFGVALGVSYSILRVIKHSAKSRIQILARIPGTAQFVNADYDENAIGYSDTSEQPHSVTVKGYSDLIKNSNTTATISEERTSQIPSELEPLLTQSSHKLLPPLEDIEGCLIIKISEPLTFTNTNDLKARLKRIELFGSAEVHPGIAKRSRNIRHVLFDLHGMTSLDSSAVQILFEIVQSYQKRGINVFFCRLSSINSLRTRLKDSGIFDLLQDTKGENFGIQQLNSPYYDEILDALKAVVEIESTCPFNDVYSSFSDFVY